MSDRCSDGWVSGRCVKKTLPEAAREDLGRVAASSREDSGARPVEPLINEEANIVALRQEFRGVQPDGLGRVRRLWRAM